MEGPSPLSPLPEAEPQQEDVSDVRAHLPSPSCPAEIELVQVQWTGPEMSPQWPGGRGGAPGCWNSGNLDLSVLVCSNTCKSR